MGSGGVDLGFSIRIGRFRFKSHKGHSAGLTNPRYVDLGDLRVKIVDRQWLTSSKWYCPSIVALSLPWGSEIEVSLEPVLFPKIPLPQFNSCKEISRKQEGGTLLILAPQRSIYWSETWSEIRELLSTQKTSVKSNNCLLFQRFSIYAPWLIK